MRENLSTLERAVEKLKLDGKHVVYFYSDERRQLLKALGGCWQVDVFGLIRENNKMREKLREQANQIITLRGRAEARENTKEARRAANYLRSLGYTKDNINTLFTNKNAEEGLWFVD